MALSSLIPVLQSGQPNDEGDVEKKVGYAGRNTLSPPFVPKGLEQMNDFNRIWSASITARCDRTSMLEGH